MENERKRILGYSTFSSDPEARKIATILIEKKLIACANIFPTIKSIYWWKGKIVTDTETAVIFKTIKGNVSEIIQIIKREHSYEIPGVVFFPIEDGNPDFLKWISKATKND